MANEIVEESQELIFTLDELKNQAKELNNVVVQMELNWRRAKENAEEAQRNFDRNSGAVAVLVQLIEAKEKTVEEGDENNENDNIDDPDLDESIEEEYETDLPPKKKRGRPAKNKADTEEIDL